MERNFNLLLINKDVLRNFLFKMQRFEFNRAQSFILTITNGNGSLNFIFNSLCISNELFIMKSFLLCKLKKVLLKFLYCSLFCWSMSFELVGYNFEFHKRIRRQLIYFDLGFSKRNILLVVPNNVKIYGRKRWFRFFASNLQKFYLIFHIFLQLRNIFPYKKRGLIPKVFPKIWLKPGKKVKYK